MNLQDADKAILRILDKQKGQSPDACPDANELAAYLESSLNASETAQFEAHAAECAACREALVLSMKITGGEEEIAAARLPESRKSSYTTSSLRLAFIGSLVVIVGIMLFQATRQKQMRQETPQVADKQGRSDISGGPGAVLRSPEINADIRSKPASTSEIAALPPAAMQAQETKDEKSSLKPVAAEAIPAAVPAQIALESRNLPRPQASDRIEETRLKALGDLVSEAQKAQRAQADAQVPKSEMTARPSEPKAQPVQVGGIANQLAFPANMVAPTSNQAANQNAQMAQTSNSAQQMTQQAAQVDRQVAVNPGRAAQAQVSGSQGGGGGRGGGGGQIGAISPLRVTDTAARAAEGKIVTSSASLSSRLDLDIVAKNRMPVRVEPGPVLSKEVTVGFARKLGNRSFYLMTRYWIDAECTRHSEAPIREIIWNSSDLRDILRKEPALSQLRATGIPVLIYWNGINYLVR
jgi:hypothetical protein